MLPELSDIMLRQWDRFFPAEKKPNLLTYLGIPGSVQGGTTTFIGFANKQRRPSFLVKIHRTSDESDRAVNERYILEKVNGRPDIFGDTVPRLLLCEKIGGLWFFVQSILDGRPMTADMSSDGLPVIERARENMELVSRWLASLNGVTKEEDGDQHDLFGSVWRDRIDEFRRIFLPEGREDDFLNEMESAVASFCKEKCNLVTRHGDFCRQNILLANGGNLRKIGVVDWTFSKRRSLPLHDLFFFLSSYFLQARKHHGIGGFTRALEYTFFDLNDYSRMIRSLVERFCNLDGIDLSTARMQFGMFLVEQAVFEYHQSVRSSRNGGLPRFNLYLASLGDKNHQEALKEHLYIYFFRAFIARREKFII
ncbi:MAG: aminoglycoside phosphotransferase family protein [Deltaproteobacteria bacterium]|nr:aminoglycoside phosphotransferase family protein [Deltaproteobacteria bacterium]